ncbi:BRO1 domain-containing protein [Aphelenchoides fujianensis]|nr:BRO1 domain-containing protein [Aphelenchoides fujianensis]
MSHWFHRQPLKATKTAKFELKQVVSNPEASKICSELRLRREQLLDLLRDSATSDLELVESEFEAYLRLFHGFVFDVENPEKNSKLRYLGKYTWTNSLTGGDAYESSDAWFEVLSMLMNFGFFYTKKAAVISAKDEVREIDAKNIHTALRKAAGIFDYVLANREKVGVIPDAAGNDLDERIVKCYQQQSIAEAQEVTIARAIELKHSPKLVSNLANETAQLYSKCDKLLDGFDSSLVEKWRMYFRLKNKVSTSFLGQFLPARFSSTKPTPSLTTASTLLTEDKCGQAIAAVKAGNEAYRQSSELCAAYAKAEGPGFTAKPEKHLFFRRIGPTLNRHMEKAQRENDFIYHEKVPDECPALESQTEFGLAKPIEWKYPPKSDLWNTTTYQAFDITKAGEVDFHAPVKKGKIALVKEPKVYETDKDPSNLSGCSIS